MIAEKAVHYRGEHKGRAINKKGRWEHEGKSLLLLTTVLLVISLTSCGKGGTMSSEPETLHVDSAMELLKRAPVFQPFDVYVSNLTSASATITWLTQRRVKGLVRYGLTEDLEQVLAEPEAVKIGRIKHYVLSLE